MIALDTTALSLLFVPGATGNTRSGKVIKHARERMEFLVEQISRDDNEVLIPTPSLSEIMVKLDPLKIDELLKRLKASQWFRVEGFDAAAAVELAMRTAKAKAAGDLTRGPNPYPPSTRFD